MTPPHPPPSLPSPSHLPPPSSSSFPSIPSPLHPFRPFRFITAISVLFSSTEPASSLQRPVNSGTSHLTPAPPRLPTKLRQRTRRQSIDARSRQAGTQSYSYGQYTIATISPSPPPLVAPLPPLSTTTRVQERRKEGRKKGRKEERKEGMRKEMKKGREEEGKKERRKE